MTLQRNRMIAAIDDAIQHDAEPRESYVYLMLADHITFTNAPLTLQKWLQSAPDDEHFRVARVLQTLDQIELAETKPAPAMVERTEQELANLIETYPNNLALFRFQLARAAGEFDLQEMERLLRNSPAGWEQDSVIWRQRGWYALQQGDVMAAQRALESARELLPLDWRIWNDLSQVTRRLGDTQLAEEYGRIALEGKELRQEIVQLPAANQISYELLSRLQQYAARCGAEVIAAQLLERIQTTENWEFLDN